MHAVILAGGRGRRMGALSHKRQKGTLHFKGTSILAQIINSTLAQKDIETIWIATGYRGEDVHRVVNEGYGKLLKRNKIRVIDAPHISGELPRFNHVVGYMDSFPDCLVRGVDTLVPASVLTEMVRRIKALAGDSVVVAASRRIYIAPSHHRVHVRGDIVEAYDPPEQLPQGSDPALHLDIGARYFPSRLVQIMANLHVPHGIDFIDGFLKSAVEHGELVHAHIFTEKWHHFGSGVDFLK